MRGRAWRFARPSRRRHLCTSPQRLKDPLLRYEKARELDSYQKPRYPLVFCHGLFGFDTFALPALPFVPNAAPVEVLVYWRGLRELYTQLDLDVLICRVPMSASIHERAHVVRDRIKAWVNADGKKDRTRINLVGHSMGGLDIRYLAARLELPGTKIHSCSSIATPHRGSPIADWFLERLGEPLILKTLRSLRFPGGGAAVRELSLEACAIRNRGLLDVDGIKYFSVGAMTRPTWYSVFRMPEKYIRIREGPNDGLVSVESSKWGKYLGTLEACNHLDSIGWSRFRLFLNRHPAVAKKLAAGSSPAFDAAAFYLGLMDLIAKEGC